jgi:hypothetical protein
MHKRSEMERKAMHRLTLVIAFVLGTISYAFAQAPAADPHHPAEGTASQSFGAQSDVQSGKPQSGQGSGSATSEPQAREMMQGMMHMMQGMQGMMRMMHQHSQLEQRQQPMQDCPMMPRSSATTEMPRSSVATADETTMRAMMQMMQGMMQMMQSQMQQRAPQ